MSAPWWEETWELDNTDPESAPVIGLKDGGVLFECNDATRACGAHAAPDMARALLVVLASGVNSSWIDDDTGEKVDMQKAARAALVKAGVPLP